MVLTLDSPAPPHVVREIGVTDGISRARSVRLEMG